MFYAVVSTHVHRAGKIDINHPFCFSYDVYGNGPNSYLMEPDTSALSLLWNQVPDSRVSITIFLTIPKLIMHKIPKPNLESLNQVKAV